MLPFLKDIGNGALKGVFAGWQIAGITTLNSGQPVLRILSTRAPREIQLGLKFYW